MSADQGKGVSRRQLLAGATVAALAAPAVAEAAGKGGAKLIPAPDEVFELTCAFKEMTIDGTKVRVRAYNDQVPGPVIKARPGRPMHIRLNNRIRPVDQSNWPGPPTKWNGNHNIPHKFDHTNLHVHGMDVIPHLFDPIGTSNPLSHMISLPPGESLLYPFELPEDHPPGLYWYHPHHHGSTVVQAVTGMAGPLIVYGAIDEVPQIKAARDVVLAINDIGLFPSDDPKDAGKNIWTYLPKQNAIWQTFGGNVTIYDPATGQAVPVPQLKGGFTTGDYALRYYLMNGEPVFKEVHNQANPQQPTPTQLPLPDKAKIRMRPGEVVRFRMLNACSDNFMPIIVEDHEVHLLALDGVNFEAVRTIPVYTANTQPQIELAPANRAEFLIKASMKPGKYRIIQLEQNQQFLESAEKILYEIEVAGEPMDMALPTALPPPTRYYPLLKADQVDNIRTIQFGGTFPGVMNPWVGIDFTINNMLYEETAVPVIVKLGDCEEWHLVVEGEHHGGTEGHPFHIHEISFEVISVGGVAQPRGTIKDTVWVPKDTTVVVRMRFVGWVGKTVFHCHILPHEDTGMMMNILMVKGDPRLDTHQGPLNSGIPPEEAVGSGGYGDPLEDDKKHHGGH